MQFAIDRQTIDSAAGLPATPGVDISISPFNYSPDDVPRQHVRLPASFTIRFAMGLDDSGGGSNDDQDDENHLLLRLATDLLGVATADVLAVKPRPTFPVPRLRAWLDKSAQPLLASENLSVISSNATHHVVDVELRHECRWWSGDGWETSGCATALDRRTGEVLCTCEHMTSFAVFFTGDDGGGVSKDNALALSLVLFIGSGISLLCLLMTAAFFFYHRKRRWVEAHQLIIANLALAMSGMHILFLLAIEPQVVTERTSCHCVAVLLHYFTLASFA